MHYKSAASDATDHHETTQSGAKLYEAGDTITSASRAPQVDTWGCGVIRVAGEIYERDAVFNAGAAIKTDGGTVSWTKVDVADSTPAPGDTRSAVFIAYGQSNARRDASKSSITYPDSLKTFSPDGEARVGVQINNATHRLEPDDLKTLMPYSEGGEDKEGIAPGFAEASDYRKIITFTPAVGGRHYRHLRPGTGPWANAKQVLRRGYKLLTDEAADQSIDLVLTWDHGEADADTVAPGGGTSETGASQAQYLDVIKNLVKHWDNAVEIQTLTPGSKGHVIGVAPCSTQGAGWRNVQNAHLEAAQTIGNFALFGPKYPYEHKTDGIHITGAGKRLYWQYVAKRWAAFLDGGAKTPTHMTSASRVGATVTVQFDTPDGADLVIDTSAVPETTTSYPLSKYGFEFDDGGTMIGVTDVTVSGTTATLTLASTPTSGGTEVVRIAQMTWPGGTNSVTGSASKLARSNIRTTTTHTHDSTDHHDWAAHQSIEVA